MITITQPIDILISHKYNKEYTINRLTLIEDGDEIITFKSYAQMAKYLGISKQGLYNKIRKNMNLMDVLAESIKK